MDRSDIQRLLESAPAVIPFIRRLCLCDLSWDTLSLFVGFESITSLIVTELYPRGLSNNVLSAPSRNFSAVVDVRLYEVELDSVGPLVRVICAFPSLQRLAVTCHGIGSDEFGFDLPGPTAYSLSPHLRVLELDYVCMDAMLDWFLSLPDRPALRAVGLRPKHTNNFSTIAKLLLTLEDSLESFLITTRIDDGSRWPFDLRRNTRLRSLQINIGGVHDNTTLVTQLLSHLSSAHIDEVGLEVTAGEDGDVYQLRWDEIDHALQNPSFSSLSTVNIRVVQWPDLYKWDPDEVPWIADHMPNCDARGILHIREVDWKSSSSYYLP